MVVSTVRRMKGMYFWVTPIYRNRGRHCHLELFGIKERKGKESLGWSRKKVGHMEIKVGTAGEVGKGDKRKWGQQPVYGNREP